MGLGAQQALGSLILPFLASSWNAILNGIFLLVAPSHAFFAASA
jgi:hypothetical protein